MRLAHTLSFANSKESDLRTRAAVYIAVLVAINLYFVRTLFFVDFTNNMQTNAGSFMAISRFILQHWPHLGWFPWWFNGEPFENSYTPGLHLVDAAFAWVTGSSVGRAFNFVTGAFYVAGPVFLFLFAWRVSRFLETSFFAAVLYSLFSPAVIFNLFRGDVSGWWNPWRLRVLVYYGEGPHTTAVSALSLALLFTYLAFTKRTYLWCAAAGLSMAFIALVNFFGIIDLMVGCGCLVLALPGSRKETAKAAALVIGIGVAAWLLCSPFLNPTLLRTVLKDSQSVGGQYGLRTLLANQVLILPGFVFLWFATRTMKDYATRFSLLFTYVFFQIVALFAIANLAVLPQPHRYGLEMEMGLALAAAFSLRGLVLRFPTVVKGALIVLMVAAGYHQMIHYRHYAKYFIKKLDVTQTMEYKVARWLDANMGGRRAFVTAQAGTWLNAFVDTPQMHSGHDPFNPNFEVEEAATYAIFSGENAGDRDAETSILWLKAFGCHAIYVPGPSSRVDGKPFNHPYKFDGVLPVLWHEEDDTIYAVPQRTDSLAHVVPLSAIVKRQPIHGLDTVEVARYVAALDDASLPDAEMTWQDPDHGRIQTMLHRDQVLSVQTTYDKGWIAIANGKPAEVTRDAIGLSVIHADCDGPCAVDFIFDGGLERKICRVLSWMVALGGIFGAFLAFKMRKLY
ncbi:MAG TPA: hypothetical protein VGG72_01255 [Bryobacteraceae bacterium]|jgi:hypothetical protein